MTMLRRALLLLLCLVLPTWGAAPRRVWLAWTVDGGPPPTWYLVERQTETEPWGLLALVDAPQQSTIDPAPRRGLNQYRVQAATADAVSPYSNVLRLRCRSCPR